MNKIFIIILTVLFLPNLFSSVEGIKKKSEEVNKQIDRYWSEIPKIVFSYDGVEIKKEVLYGYIECILDKFKRKGIEYPDEKIDVIIKNRLKSVALMYMNCKKTSDLLNLDYNIFAEEAFSKTRPDITKDTQQWRNEGILNLQHEKMQEYLLEQMFETKKVSQKEIDAFYKNNKKEFEVKDSLILYHVSIEPDENISWDKAEITIKDVFEKIQNGGDFAEYAEKYNKGRSKKIGGYLGYCRRGELSDKNLEKKVWEMVPDRIGELDMVKSNRAWHIIKVTEYNPVTYMPLEKVKENITKHLKKEKALDELKLIEKDNLEICEKEVDKAFIERTAS